MCNILVVDDDQTLCDLMEAIFSDEGHEVRCARSGAEALAMACEREPDLIVTDLWLRHESGASFIETYRQLPDSHARIVVVSGMANLDDEAVKLKADGFLGKPFQLDDLISTVASVLPAAA
jgi:CheY-like chemotaxis protein